MEVELERLDSDLDLKLIFPLAPLVGLPSVYVNGKAVELKNVTPEFGLSALLSTTPLSNRASRGSGPLVLRVCQNLAGTVKVDALIPLCLCKYVCLILSYTFVCLHASIFPPEMPVSFPPAPLPADRPFLQSRRALRFASQDLAVFAHPPSPAHFAALTHGSDPDQSLAALAWLEVLCA